MFEVRAGTVLEFRNGADVLVGVVNGAPYVVCDPDAAGNGLHVRIPVHVRDGNRSIDVAGFNVVRVERPSERAMRESEVAS